MGGMRLVRAALYAAQAVVLGAIVALTGPGPLAPVTARLGGEDVAIATVHVGGAAAVLLVLGALIDGGIAVIPALQRRARLVTWIGWSQVAAISVFLVAQLNGIVELTTLVALYAITAGAVLLLALDAETPGSRGLRRPAALAAVIGIVPWGLIAFAQIGGGVVGEPVGVVTRILTLVILGVAIGVWLRAWFRPESADPPGILPLLSTTALAWGAVASTAA